ncbi:MAG: S41 family peptidase [Clostridia bacterium]|nr:S41 family peptidase [Clostridia bacterium]
MSENKISKEDLSEEEQPLLDYADSVNADESTDYVKKNKEKRAKKEKKEKKKRTFGGELRVNALALFLGAVVLVVVCVFGTFFFAGKFYESQYFLNPSTKVSFDSEETDLTKIAKFQEIIDFIDEKYYEEYDINTLIEGAIDGMVESLEDDYSKYYLPDTMEEYTSFIDGTYNGVGIVIEDNENGKYVSEVTADSPAEKAGVKVGDIMTKVNGTAVVGMAMSELSSYFETEGTVLEIEFLLADGTTTVRKITVSAVKEPTVYAKDIDGGIKYIQITQFISGTSDEFRSAVETAVSGNSCKGIILDLRNNPGGYESEASKVADIILPEGVIATAKDRSGTVVKTVNSDADCISVPMVILINQNTASAAELVTGAFRDFEKGDIIGVKSYGKALGQQNKEFSADGSGIVLSTSRYYTPSGECIDKVGITPTQIVELEDAYSSLDPDAIPEGADLQLNAALEALGIEVKDTTENVS